MDNKKLLIKLDSFYLSYLREHGSDEDVQAYELIKQMIQESGIPEKQKPEVTEEWIEEKATKMSNIVISFNTLGSGTNWIANPLERCKDFIRSLVEEIK